MINEKSITDVVSEKFAGTEFFIVDIRVKPGNRITLTIDGDHGVSIENCIEVSRFIESKFDREAEDYELNVESAGLDRPLRLPRQFKKNIGRDIVFIGEEGKKIRGKITDAGDDGITLLPAPTKKEKQKKTEPAPLSMKYGEFRDARVEVSFK